ncbi:hypothetical protein C5167_010005 [Papaver somniferum]|uniref:Uncharacterized protein n=1 Tax=Papaver somniferum TaxID=3469 RepID=A0A4Y7K0E2_PAPSO|nr:hypothetical protein C5167_010005 [Papaver somniferum]
MSPLVEMWNLSIASEQVPNANCLMHRKFKVQTTTFRKLRQAVKTTEFSPGLMVESDVDENHEITSTKRPWRIRNRGGRAHLQALTAIEEYLVISLFLNRLAETSTL